MQNEGKQLSKQHIYGNNQNNNVDSRMDIRRHISSFNKTQDAFHTQQCPPLRMLVFLTWHRTSAEIAD